MTGDLRSQILIEVEQRGADSINALVRQLERIKAQVAQAATELQQGSKTADEFQRSVRALGSSFEFFNGLVKEATARQEGMDQAAQKSIEVAEQAAARRAQVEREVNELLDQSAAYIERAKAREATAHQKAAEAAGRAAVVEAERQAKILAGYEQWVQKSEAVANATVKVGAATSTAGGEVSQFQNIVAQAGDSLDDVVQTAGGWERKLTGIGNSAQVALAPFSLWGVAAGVVATSIASVATNWDSLAGFVETRNPIPQSADALGRLDEALKRVNDELAETRKHETLNAEQTERYNDLLARRVELEKQRTEASERRKELEEPGESANGPGYSADEESAATRRDVVGQETGAEPFVRSLVEAQRERDREAEAALGREAERTVRESLATGKLDPHYAEVLDRLREVVLRLEDPETARRFAEELARGKETGSLDVLELLRGAPGAFTPGTTEGFRMASPETTGADRGFEAQMERARREKQKSDELGSGGERDALGEGAESPGIPRVRRNEADLDGVLREEAAREAGQARRIEAAAQHQQAEAATSRHRAAIEQGTQGTAGATPEQAELVAPYVERLVHQGFTPIAAGQLDMAQLMHSISRSQEQLAAMNHQLMGVLANVQASQHAFYSRTRGSGMPSLLSPVPFG